MIERWGRRRFMIGFALTILVALIAVLPPAIAVGTSFSSPTSETWAGGSYEYVFETYGGSLWLSLRLAMSVTVLSIIIGGPAAYAFARFPFPGSRVIERVAVTPLALPGVTVAIALIIGYTALRGNWFLLAGAQMLYTIPYVLRVLGNSLRNLPLDELEAVGKTLGAGRARRFRSIVLPLLLQPVLLAALIVFAISWGEFNVSFLLATPLQSPFSAALYATYTSNSEPVAGAATAIFIAGAIPFIVALQLLDRRAVTEGQGA